MIRATMIRAHGILAEWGSEGHRGRARTPGETRRDHAIKALEAELRLVKAERAAVHGRLDAAATVIAALHFDNQALRDQLHYRGDIVDLRSCRQDTETADPWQNATSR
ncbi:hypothetical protein [Catenulispora rubra]|uniref:hypothetical protein n=1 Tax=Catenulispora rubra TaxID=280293 RepID=UPI001892112A|nr:hypothetical protein [Catenulispora rubra]